MAQLSPTPVSGSKKKYQLHLSENVHTADGLCPICNGILAQSFIANQRPTERKGSQG